MKPFVKLNFRNRVKGQFIILFIDHFAVIQTCVPEKTSKVE